MTTDIKKFSAAAALCLACLLCAGAEAVREMNSILASVNGAPISLQDVLPLTRAEEFKAAHSSSGKTLQKRVSEIRRKAVDELIDRKLILEDYAAKKFEIADRDIESTLDELAERSGARSRSEFTEKLRRQGGSIEIVRKNVRETMIIQLMLHREYSVMRTITPEQMYAFYRQQQKEQKNNDKIELAMLLLPRDDPALVSKIGAELKKDPGRFAALAAAHSAGPGREDGGKLGKIEYRLLRPEFSQVLKSPQKGRICGPLKTPEGIVFLKVLDITVSTKKNFKESIPEIRKKLEAEQRRRSKTVYTRRLRQNAVIRYFF